MSYRLGVDVGGTFTDVLLVDEQAGSTWRAKTASTPHDQSAGVLHGINKVCEQAGVDRGAIAHLLHGTTVATNAILEGKGATVGLVTTEGFRQVLQIARSFVPGGLAGWIIWPKPEPLAALENTVEVPGRIASDGSVVRELDEDAARAQLRRLRARGHRGAGRLADQRVRQRRARAAGGGARGRGTARRAGLAVQRRAARAAGIRAGADHGGQRLRAAAGGQVRGQPERPARRRGRARPAVHPAQRRRAGGGGRRDRRARHHAAVRPGRGRHRGGLGRRAVGPP